MGNIGTSLRNIAMAPVRSIGGLAVHPLQSISATGFKNPAHPLEGYEGPDPLTETAKGIKEHPIESAEGLAGNLLAGKFLPSIGSSVMRGAGTVNDALIGTPSKAIRYGAEPGLQMAKEGIAGTSPARLSSLIQEKLPVATAEHRAIVANAPANTLINSGPLISQPFQDVVAGATNPRTGAGGISAIKSALRTERELTNTIDPQTGNLTANMRNPHISPLEATQLKVEPVWTHQLRQPL